MHKIITMNDLINYLKIPDFSEKVNREIITVKITRTALFQKETILLKDFPRTNKELSIPQTLFIDTDNVAYNKHILHGNTYYKRISYNKDPRVFTDANFQEPLVSVNIPNHLYNEGIRFYINPNHQLIGFIAVAHVDNSKDYINFNPDNFSVFNENTYHYSNVYGTKTLEKLKIVTASSNASAHRFPILSKQLGDSNPYQLSYYYKKDTHKMLASFALDENEKPMIALKIGFKTLSGVLSFLKETIFNYYNEVNDFRSKWRHRFLERIGYHITPVANTSNLKNKKALIYQIPEALYYVFYNNSSLWAAVQILASGTITNILGTNEEDLLLKLLKIIYHRHTHKYNKVQDVGRKVVDEKEAPTSKRLNDIYLNKLLTIKADNKILLQKLTDDLDGEQFKTYVYFIWSIWKNSSYANINPKTNKTIKITGESPVLLDYRSDKTLGIHYNNATINWEANTFRIDLDIRIKTGTKKVPKLVNIAYETPKPQYIDTGQTTEVAIYQTFQYGYHPFSPTVLLNSKNPTFLLKDKDQKEGIRFTKLPAFLLYANNQKAFWENVLTGVEYSVDILTTVSGVGNLIKAGRLVKLLKNGKNLLYKTKQVTTAIATTKAIAGVIEVSSGTVNALLKLTSIDDTKLGISISKYLFYLEMIALTGEVSVFLKGKLQQSAKEIVENPKFTKSLDKLVKKGESNEIIEYLDGVAEVVSIGRGRYLGQSLRALDFDFIRKFLIKNKVDLQIGKTKGTFEVEGYFYKSGNIMKMDYENAALFITDGKNMKLVLRENATVYELLHELMHFRHSKELGIKNYYNMLQAEGVLKTERYVFDKIVSNFKYLNKNELNHAERYINYYYKKLGVTDDLGSPIKIVLPFDINSIPKKRQYISIETILNLK